MKKDMSKDMRRISLVLEKCAIKWLRIRKNEDVISFAPFKYVWVRNGTSHQWFNDYIDWKYNNDLFEEYKYILILIEIKKRNKEQLS